MKILAWKTVAHEVKSETTGIEILYRESVCEVCVGGGGERYGISDGLNPKG